jgi:hypothetical protein
MHELISMSDEDPLGRGEKPMRIDYDRIQESIAGRARKVDDFLAMHRNSDPYYVGSAKHKMEGQWFAENWERFGFTRGVHVRRMHYALVSASPAVLMPNGCPYINTMKCYDFLDEAATSARYLDYVDPALFVDHRNEEPVVLLDFNTQRACEIAVKTSFVTRPDSEIYLPFLPHHEIVTFSEPQRYHLEIWCEKSTMNDILIPLARAYQAALVYGKGELSITLAYQAVQRFQRMNKPVRIFYVSDFDPSGRDMPVNMIRKVEYFLDKFDLLNTLDVKLFPVVLTPEQVRYYATQQPPLLTTPLKEDNVQSRARAEKFYRLYGVDGGVELDALEIVHPGELRRILTQELDRYYDHDLARRVRQSRYEAEKTVEEEDKEVSTQHQQEITELERLEKEIQHVYHAQLTPLLTRYFDVYHAVSNALQHEMAEKESGVSEDDIPLAEQAEERDGALFDSSSAYEEQLDVYKRFKRNEIETEAIA